MTPRWLGLTTSDFGLRHVKLREERADHLRRELHVFCDHTYKSRRWRGLIRLGLTLKRWDLEISKSFQGLLRWEHQPHLCMYFSNGCTLNAHVDKCVSEETHFAVSNSADQTLFLIYPFGFFHASNPNQNCVVPFPKARQGWAFDEQLPL